MFRRKTFRDNRGRRRHSVRSATTHRKRRTKFSPWKQTRRFRRRRHPPSRASMHRSLSAARQRTEPPSPRRVPGESRYITYLLQNVPMLWRRRGRSSSSSQTGGGNFVDDQCYFEEPLEHTDFPEELPLSANGLRSHNDINGVIASIFNPIQKNQLNFDIDSGRAESGTDNRVFVKPCKIVPDGDNGKTFAVRIAKEAVIFPLTEKDKIPFLEELRVGTFLAHYDFAPQIYAAGTIQGQMADPDAPEGSNAMVAGVRFYQVIETVVPVRTAFHNVRFSERETRPVSPFYLETMNKAFDLYEEVAAEMDFLPLDIKIDNLGFIGDRLVMFDADPTWMIFKEQFDSAMEKSIVRFRVRTGADPKEDLIINAKPRFLQYLFAAITLMMANWENSNTEYLLRREGVEILLREKIAAFTNQLFYRILLLAFLEYSAFETIIRHYCFSNFENRNSHMVNIGFNARILTESTIFRLWKRHINKELKTPISTAQSMYLTETDIRALLPPLPVDSVVPPPAPAAATSVPVDSVIPPTAPAPAPSVASASVMPPTAVATSTKKKRRKPLFFEQEGVNVQPKGDHSEEEGNPAKKQGTDTNPFSAFASLPTN